MKKYLALLALLLVAVWCSGAALAATYHVGSGQTYSTLNDLYSSITPGDNDVILVHPGTYGTIAIYSGGGSSQATATESQIAGSSRPSRMTDCCRRA